VGIRRVTNHNRTPSCRHTLKSNRGQTLIEYVLIVVVISVALIAALTVLRNGLSTTYSNAATSIPRSP